MDISASYIREMIYAQAKEGKREREGASDQKWSDFVPHEVFQIIMDNWGIVRNFASFPDRTRKFMGLKFPTEGFL
jgi:hypothetical protein